MAGHSWERWPNTTTWLANLWLSNEPDLYAQALDMGRRCPTAEVVGGYLVERLRSRCILDEAMRGDFRDGRLDLVKTGVLGQAWIDEAAEVDRVG